MSAISQTHAETARRIEAFTILESIEELIWAASKRNETIPQTRLYYEKIIAGYDPDTPKPLYTEAGWGDELPPPIEVGQDPRIRGRQETSVKAEMEDAGDEADAAGASHEKRSSSGDGGVRIKIEDALDRDREEHGTPVQRPRDDATAGDKRKRIRRTGQSPRLPGQ